MKQMFAVLIAMLIWGFASALAETILVSGDVSGTWSADTVLVTGEIRVPPNSTLIIEPGVEVLFQTYCKFIVDDGAVLTAIGVENDSIFFDEFYPDTSWHGIRFLNASNSCRLEYCRISNGHAIGEGWDANGGGLFSSDCDVTISHCLFDNCVADGNGGALGFVDSNDPVITHTDIIDNSAGNFGGGMYFYHCYSFTISHCEVNGNVAIPFGGGICSWASTPNIINCEIYGNSATQGGGLYVYHQYANVFIVSSFIHHNYAYLGSGVYCDTNASPVFTNCTISDNSHIGITCYYNSHPSLHNCILWGHPLGSYSSEVGTFIVASFSVIEGGLTGSGNIDQDPLFVDPDNGDYHLQSTVGSYHGGLWLQDSNHSPCIDAGDPASEYDNEPEPNGFRVNMGAYGNTVEASLSIGPNLIAGSVYGTWAGEDSPFHVIGDIWVPADSTLIIEEGVEVFFWEHYVFSVLEGATLQAFGIAGDSVLFAALDAESGWGGIHFNSSSDASRLEYCTIRYGKAEGGWPNNCGGGLLCLNTSPTIQHCTFGYCEADLSGGGIACISEANPTIDNSNIVNCTAWDMGGGFFCSEYSNPVIQDCFIDSCDANSGGGFACRDTANPGIVNCTISHSSADYLGGGIYLEDYSNPVIQNCMIDSCTAEWGGGGIACNTNASPTISSSIITHNSSDYVGGGVFCMASSNASINNCIVCLNTSAFFGAGINCSFCNPSITNTVIFGNIAYLDGGGIRIIGISSVTFVNNICWDNQPQQILPLDGGEVTVIYSNVESGWPGEGNIGQDPLFINGPLSDYHLSPTSPCIDTGNPDSQYNDPEDPMSPGYALWPALGTIRNDMGAYGGGGVSGWLGIIEGKRTPLPEGFRLFQNFPNPFNATTTISYSLPEASLVSLKVFNVQGCFVAQLIDGWRPAGIHGLIFEASELSSGVYVYRLEASEFTARGKMVLMR